jgi:hypothetical protein
LAYHRAYTNYPKSKIWLAIIHYPQPKVQKKGDLAENINLFLAKSPFLEIFKSLKI